MKKKILGLLLILGMLTGCTSKTNTNIVNISVLNSKPEIQKSLEQAAEKFTHENPKIRVKVVQHSNLLAVEDKIASMNNQETTPTMMIVDASFIQDFKDNLVPLHEEKWNEVMNVTMGQASTNKEGQLIAFPFALEGIGFIYNEEVMKEAGVDVSQIHTRDQLEEAFKKVEQIGKAGVVVSNEDWSLANHFFTTALTVQSEEGSKVAQYAEALRQKKVDLKADARVNGLLDTFDLMKAYNLYKADPLAPTAEICAEALATEQAGFWYMGNWAIGNLNKFGTSSEKYGFIPVPVSNDASDFANQNIMGTIKYLVINQQHNSVEQQEAAKYFLEWLVYAESGKDFMIGQANLIPGAVDGEVTYEDSLAQSIQTYQAEGKVMEHAMIYLPDNNPVNVGGLLRQYLVDEIDRETLLENIAAFWAK